MPRGAQVTKTLSTCSTPTIDIEPDGLSVVACELIAPLGIAIAVAYRVLHRAEASRGIGILLLGLYIAPLVVGIGVGRIIAVSAAIVKILADKLICGVVRMRILF